jgi:hypothetical protein
MKCSNCLGSGKDHPTTHPCPDCLGYGITLCDTPACRTYREAPRIATHMHFEADWETKVYSCDEHAPKHAVQLVRVYNTPTFNNG